MESANRYLIPYQDTEEYKLRPHQMREMPVYRLLAVTQNQPLWVEIRGFKTGHSLGVKTALDGLVNARPEGHVECRE